MTAKPTPLPWVIKHGTNIFGQRADTKHEGIVANTGGHAANFVDCTPENEANAEFICRAVNSHAELVAACKRALTYLTWQDTLGEENRAASLIDTLDKLRAALANAERES